MKPTLDAQGESPSCIAVASLNALEKQKGIDLDVTEVAKFYQLSQLPVDGQRFPTIFKAMQTFPLGGFRLKEYKRIWAWYNKTPIQLVIDSLDNAKSYVFGIKVWRTEDGKKILPGSIEWGRRGKGTYNGQIIGAAPLFHAVSFLEKGSHLKLENSWKAQHIIHMPFSSIPNEVSDIWELEFE